MQFFSPFCLWSSHYYLSQDVGVPVKQKRPEGPWSLHRSPVCTYTRLGSRSLVFDTISEWWNKYFHLFRLRRVLLWMSTFSLVTVVSGDQVLGDYENNGLDQFSQAIWFLTARPNSNYWRPDLYLIFSTMCWCIAISCSHPRNPRFSPPKAQIAKRSLFVAGWNPPRWGLLGLLDQNCQSI